MENENKIIPTPTPVASVVKNKSIETYAEDMAKVIEGNEGELIKTIIHEQEIQEAEKKNLSPKTQKNRVYVFVGFILFFLAICLFVFLVIFKQNANTVPIQGQSTPLIFTDQNYFQDVGSLKKEEVAQSVFNEVHNSDVGVSSIEAIYLTINKKPIGLREFIKITESSFVVPLPPLVDDNFLIGTFNKNNNKDLFMLLKVRSFLDVFDSMKSWEGKMFNDLHGFFGVNISADTQDLLSKDFVDGMIQNKNSRILYDKNGKIVLMYIFANDNSVIITNSEDAAAEVILRLSGSQISK